MDTITRNVLTVTQINRYIKQLFSFDSILSAVWVSGEISNFKHHSSGHMYFTLKDENSLIKCIMFKGYSQNIKFKINDGLKVIIKGQVSVYEKDGMYQLYAEYMEPDGVGALHLAFEQMKKELSSLGYFDEKNKKPIPFMPGRICVITSPTGAVIKDMLNILSRRFPNFNLYIYKVAVQGENAALQISRAIKNCNDKDIADILVVARGGGSLEELWAFNERVVADAILESKTPIISAVGHETDFTIADFVADLRAPTPSAAAEVLLPEKILLISKIDSMSKRLVNALYQFSKIKRKMIEEIMKRPCFSKPLNIIYTNRIALDTKSKWLEAFAKNNIDKKRMAFFTLTAKLEGISPLGVLTRGFGVIRNFSDGILIKSVHKVRKNDKIIVELKDGQILCQVEATGKIVR